MELLPHELRYLIDSNVVRRFPDRMVPPGTPFSDWASRIPRVPVSFIVSEPHMNNTDKSDWLTTDSVYKAFFEMFGDSCSGCGPDITVGTKHYHAAHHRIDYAKIYDVPSDMKMPDFTH